MSYIYLYIIYVPIVVLHDNNKHCPNQEDLIIFFKGDLNLQCFLLWSTLTMHMSYTKPLKMLQDISSGTQFTILTDRSHGGASLKDGSLELMVTTSLSLLCVYIMQLQLLCALLSLCVITYIYGYMATISWAYFAPINYVYFTL